MSRRRSSYGVYNARGLFREGCGSKPLNEWCEDCNEALDTLTGRDIDTYRRVMMRFLMRQPRLNRRGGPMRSAYRAKRGRR